MSGLILIIHTAFLWEHCRNILWLPECDFDLPMLMSTSASAVDDFLSGYRVGPMVGQVLPGTGEGRL